MLCLRLMEWKLNLAGPIVPVHMGSGRVALRHVRGSQPVLARFRSVCLSVKSHFARHPVGQMSLF
jgi:hypothetical protein